MSCHNFPGSTTSSAIGAPPGRRPAALDGAAPRLGRVHPARGATVSDVTDIAAHSFDRDSVRSLAAAAGWALQSLEDTVDCYQHCPDGSQARHELTVFYDASGAVVAAHADNWDPAGRSVSFPVTASLSAAFNRSV